MAGLLLASLLSLSLAPTSGALLSDLRVENVDAPLAVASTRPRFSWVTGEVQEAYRIVVTRFDTILWDSGVVSSPVSSMVQWNATAPPPPDSDLTWALSVTLDGIGVVTTSAPFSTAPAAPLPGAWISGFDTLRASMFLSSEPVLRARLHVTGVGCYHAYVNGVRVSAELSPGFGHAPNARSLYDTFDVAELLTPGGGENVVGIRLGSCKLGYVGQYCNDTAIACNAAWALLSVSQSGGNVTAFASDGSWVGSNGPIVYQHLYNGEIYDSRLEAKGWNVPGFKPLVPWSQVLTPNKTGVLGPLTPAVSRPVIRATSQSPVAVTAQSDGSFVYDFGRNMAGICTLFVEAASAPANTVFTLYHGEVLFYEGGPVHNTYDYNPCVGRGGPPGSDVNCAKQNVTYIAAGGQNVSFTTHFSYAGFRYVQLFGWAAAGNAGPPPSGALTCHFIHTDLPLSGGVYFGNASDPASATLNALQAAVVQTHLSNFVSVPTDCPQVSGCIRTHSGARGILTRRENVLAGIRL
jgi:alpha-L-rhamnosidase